MPKRMKSKVEPETDDGQSQLKKALIVFAIIEALVMIPLLLYRIFR